MLFVLAFTLLPLAVYCTILSRINRRPHAVLVGGTWDFVGLLVGVSGFLLLVGPYVINALHDRWLGYRLFHRPTAAVELWVHEAGYLWTGVNACYFLVLAIGTVWLLLRRRRVTAIYNVDPDTVPDLLVTVLEDLHVPWTRTGQQFFRAINPLAHGPDRSSPGVRGADAEPVPDSQVASPPMPRRRTAVLTPQGNETGDTRPLLDVDAFPGMCHVNLYWHPGADTVRHDVERDLRKAFRNLPAPPNRAGLWFAVLASTLFTLLLSGVGLWVTLVVLASMG